MSLPVPLFLIFIISSSSSIPSFDIFFLLLTFQESSDPDYIINPCYPEGYNVTMNASAIYDTECTKKPQGYKPDQPFFLVGANDSDKCESIVKSIFDFQNCSSSQCSFNGVEQPAVNGDFMVTPSANRTQVWRWIKMKTNLTICFYCPCQAYAGFFYTARALGINRVSDLDEFKALVKKFCRTHWTKVSSSTYSFSNKSGRKGGIRSQRGWKEKKE